MHVLFIFIFFVWTVKVGNSQEQQASNVEFCAHNKHNGVDSPMGTKRKFVVIGDYNALPWFSFTYDYWQDLAPAMRASSQLRGENSKLSATWGDPGSNDGPQQLYGTSPRFADLDSDGDLDLVVGISLSASIVYFENIGSNTTANFVLRKGQSDNPFYDVGFLTEGGNYGMGYLPHPTFGDLDGDGLLDVVVRLTTGGHNPPKPQKLYFLRNVGTAQAAKFYDASTFGNSGKEPPCLTLTPAPAPAPAAQGSAECLDEILSTHENDAEWLWPNLVDLDADGDLDLVLSTVYFQNTGSASAHNFVMMGGDSTAAVSADATRECLGGTVTQSSTLILSDVAMHPDRACDGNDGTPAIATKSPPYQLFLNGNGGCKGGVLGSWNTDSSNLNLEGITSKPYTPAQCAKICKTKYPDTALYFTIAGGDKNCLCHTLCDTPENGGHDSYQFGGTADAWWKVTFASPQTMSYVEIKNRDDCCPETLNGARVEVMTAAGSWLTCGSDVSGATLGGVYRRECTSLLAADVKTVLQIKISNPSGGDGKIVPLAEVICDNENEAAAVDSRDPLSEFPRGKQLMFVDMDNDGDLDVFVELEQWERSGGLKDYWENIGSPKSPAFAERSGGVSLLSFPEKPFDRMGSCTFADLNGDMHEEVYCGGSNGEKNGGENGVNIPNCCGAKTNAQGAPKIFKMAVPEMVGGVFSRSTSVENPFLDDTSGKYLYSTPINGMETTLKEYLDSSMVSFFDMDADGDLDLLCGQGFLNEEPTNNYQYFENEGSATSPIFTPRSKADSPFHALPSRYNGYPNGDDDNPTGLDGPRYGGGNGVIVDLDGDGTFAVVFYFLLLFVLSFDIFLTNLHHFTRFYFSLNL